VSFSSSGNLAGHESLAALNGCHVKKGAGTVKEKGRELP
jgi:hypothetical protein